MREPPVRHPACCWQVAAKHTSPVRKQKKRPPFGDPLQLARGDRDLEYRSTHLLRLHVLLREKTHEFGQQEASTIVVVQATVSIAPVPRDIVSHLTRTSQPYCSARAKIQSTSRSDAVASQLRVSMIRIYSSQSMQCSGRPATVRVKQVQYWESNPGTDTVWTVRRVDVTRVSD